MLKIEFVYDSRLDGLEEKIRQAVGDKLKELTRQLYDKVIENVSGRILQKQSGELLASIQKQMFLTGEVMEGTVFVEPETPKAWALEKGGVRAYDIYPTKATMLHWISKDGKHRFAKHVLHPPSAEFAYLRTALEEMAPIIPEEFTRAISDAIAGAPL